MENLKLLLLNTLPVLDNEYLDLYVLLIIDNKDTLKIKYLTQRHHIVPRCYFKSHNLPIDNSDTNLVNLLYKEHLLAHLYLGMASSDLYFLYLMFLGCRACFRSKEIAPLSKRDIKQVICLLDEYQTLYQTYKKVLGQKTSKLHKGKIVTEQLRLNMSKARKGKLLGPRPEEIRLKISQSNKGKKLSEQTKEKLRAAHTGKVLSEEHKLKISQTLKGKPKKWAGRKLSMEEIEVRRKKLIGRIVSDETKHKISQALKGRKINRIPTGGFKKGNIPWNKGKTTQSKGTKCMYDPSKDIIIYVQPDEISNYEAAGYILGNPKLSKLKKGKEAINKRAVICLDTNIIYESVKEATLAANSGVMNCLKGISKTCKGYSWAYVDELKFANLRCVDIELGTGVNANRLGAITVEFPYNDKVYQVKVGSGFTQEQRDYFWQNKNDILWKIVEVQYFEITQNQNGGYSLRFPVFCQVRNDKDEISLW